ncbi:putative disease resistance protein RGA3 [Humulus lupulus]|uniref:putative disease resistance protein RGA3 n=1 Tax=Humulus lupulus TaxID=3486 RepID=UPI002B414E36|nr:putative disease resistance protein RGA3 [Humulus lupulus]
MGDDCNTRKVVMRLLEGAGVPARNLPMDRLQRQLQRTISGKRCFVVMDNMVEDDPLDRHKLKDLFKGCARGSCVLQLLTTTSKKQVDQSYCLDQKIDEQVRSYKDLLNGIRVANGERRRPIHSFVPQDVVVGREAEKQAIIEQLLEENMEENPLVIPIIGIGGLGKTALAQLIFNDDKIESHFDLKTWVVVTDGAFDVKAIIENIIQSVTGNWPEDLGFDRLEILLRQQMRGKRYLLILDDVWNEDEVKWKQLIDLLSDGAHGSGIIVTTRIQKVAKITGEKHRHELQILDEDQSWELFQEVAFVQIVHPTDPEIKIGRKIAKKCGGVPLVIRTIGSMLFTRDPETEWQPFHDKELPTILKDVTTTTTTTTALGVKAVLELSYGHLPSPLKECFNCCALFPKDYEIDVGTLISLWTSHGFIDPRGQQGLEKVAYDSFMDLLGRSFFQETKTDELGKITKCKMQNLMYDLAREKAGKVYDTLRLQDHRSNDGSLSHASLDFHFDSSWQFPTALTESKEIHSLIFPRQFRWPIECRSSESICDVILQFKSLRMLDLHNSGIKILPDAIGELIDLCYLDLSQNVNIKSLPSSISRLKNLQTLKLNHCSNLQALPRGITMLSNLRNLENESCYCLTHMPQRLRQLSQLRRLSEFVLSNSLGSLSNKGGKLDELRNLIHLGGNLKIKNLSCPKSDQTKEAELKHKTDLLSLILIWDINASVNEADYKTALKELEPHPNLRELSISAYGGSEFSRWLLLLKNLVKLSLSRCNGCHCLPPLDRLPNLKVLVVDELMKLEYILEKSSPIESKTPFPSLKELQLTNLPELKGWRKGASENVEEETTFTCLSKLVVENCPKLTSMPPFPCLEELLVLQNTSWEPFKRTTLFKLRALHIIDMPDGDHNMWQSLPSLRSVTLDHLADINDHLERLQQVTSLQQLHIWRCDKLEEIPSWISKVKTLKTISIKLCPNLLISPEGINLLTSLRKVEIEDCPRVSHIENMLKDPSYTYSKSSTVSGGLRG